MIVGRNGARSRQAHDLSRLRGRVEYTTGEVAAICRVAPRTVTKWFDAGRLKGYRLPMTSDRRIPRAALLAFMRASGMDVAAMDPDAAAPPAPLVAGCERTAAAIGGEYVASGFALATRLEALAPLAPPAVVLAGHVGRELAGHVRDSGYAGPLVWLLGEDGGDPPPGCVGVAWPHDPAAVRAACGPENTRGEG